MVQEGVQLAREEEGRSEKHERGVGVKQAIAQILKAHKRVRLCGMSKGIQVRYHSLSHLEYHLSSAVSKHPQG